MIPADVPSCWEPGRPSQRGAPRELNWSRDNDSSDITRQTWVVVGLAIKHAPVSRDFVNQKMSTNLYIISDQSYMYRTLQWIYFFNKYVDNTERNNLILIIKTTNHNMKTWRQRSLLRLLCFRLLGYGNYCLTTSILISKLSDKKNALKMMIGETDQWSSHNLLSSWKMNKVVLGRPGQSARVWAELVQAVAVGFMLLNDGPDQEQTNNMRWEIFSGLTFQSFCSRGCTSLTETGNSCKCCLSDPLRVHTGTGKFF